LECYNNQFVALQIHVASLRTWVVCELVVKVLFPIVFGCVLNQSHGHRLLIDVLQFVILICRDIKKNYRSGLFLITSLKKMCLMWVERAHASIEIIDFWGFSTFHFFLHTFDKRKDHNMLAFMFDPRFKNMWLATMFLGHENSIIMVVKYDQKYYYLY
jgi:hypothetical protein